VGRVAAAVGVEVIPAIQALGHLEQVLHWPANAKYRDNPNVLLAGVGLHKLNAVECSLPIAFESAWLQPLNL
jgi:hypothetical protein